MNLGLYGGSFDPVHLGHLLVAQAAREELALDRIFFIPAAQSPFKPGTVPASAAARVRMLRLALAGDPRAEVDLQELERGGVSYTIDTVRDYCRRFPEAKLHLLIGADHVPSLPKWREAETLASITQFVVIPRPGQIPFEPPASYNLRVLKGFPLGVSSSEIRDRVRRGLSIRHLVPDAVAEFIRSEQIYSV
ncbi:MAG: nicotinate (nicotinamide) nucleotide adenylyltransferase [Verrucomicrobia bacterium]|nr:nicotinate (nicotinamide) nucleotide adenylyltransferase [Verrucomicrobiota bacterium]